MADFFTQLSEWTSTGDRGTKGTYPGIFLQKLLFQVYLQEVGHGDQPGYDVGHFLAEISVLSAISPGELSHFLKEPKEGLIWPALGIPGEVNLANQILKLLNLQGPVVLLISKGA